MGSGVSASQKYAPEIHSVMMTGALREKFPNLASHIGAYVYGCTYALAVDDDSGFPGGAWRGCLSQHSLRVTAPEASRYLVCRV